MSLESLYLTSVVLLSTVTIVQFVMFHIVFICNKGQQFSVKQEAISTFFPPKSPRHYL